MLPAGIRRLFRLPRRRVEEELDAELDFHFEQKVAALMDRGMDPAAARAEAERQFGDLRTVRRELLAVDLGGAAREGRREWLAEWGLDARHALRSLGHTPVLTATIVVLLAIGIGANTAMLGILDRLLLRAPPHLVNPGELAVVRITTQRTGQPSLTHSVGPYPDIEDYARRVSGFTAVAGYTMSSPARLGAAEDERQARRVIVTRDYFRVLGTTPVRGRTFDADDPAGPPVAVISYGFWRGEFGGRDDVLGATVMLDSTTYTVVGVMPEGFSGAELDAPDAWTLADHGGLWGDWRTQRNTYMLVPIARRASGATDAQIIAQIAAARAPNLAGQARFGTKETVRLASVIPGRRSDFDTTGIQLAVAVAAVSVLLLLVAVANVTNLLLVRAVVRVREFAVRAALGAGRGRLLRLVVTESAMLALAGGAAAGLVGLGAGYGLRALLLPRWQWAFEPLGLLPAAFAAALSLAIGLGTGLLPGLLAGRDEALGALRTGGHRSRGARSRVRGGLVALQVALSLLLCIGSGLFWLSFQRAAHEDHGLALQSMLLANVDVGGDAAAQAAALDQVAAAVRRVPGVAGATIASSAPMYRLDFAVVKPDRGDSSFGAMTYRVRPDFLAVGGLRVIAGRGFTPSDDAGAEKVAVIDSIAAARRWAGASPLGRCLTVATYPGCYRVIGVSAHIRPTGLRDDPMAQVYLPIAQAPTPDEYSVLVRAAVDDPESLREPIWRAIAGVLPEFKRTRVQSYAALLDPGIRPWRVGVVLFSLSALLALLLSSIGTYAVMAFAVRQRTGEFGVRRALGASAWHIIKLVLGEGLVVAGVGLAAGIGGALLLARAVQPLLYRVSPRDPAVTALAAGLLLAVVLAASLGAAAIALRVNPREALQAD